jgi:hypothetical protein
MVSDKLRGMIECSVRSFAWHDIFGLAFQYYSIKPMQDLSALSARRQGVTMSDE